MPRSTPQATPSRPSASPTSARRPSPSTARDGRALAPAIVWQDRRTAAACDELSRRRTRTAASARAPASPRDPYFSATKMRWLLDSGRSTARGDLGLCTVDTLVCWHLTAAPERRRLCDRPVQCVTHLLYDLDARRVERGALRRSSGSPCGALAEVRASCGVVRRVARTACSTGSRRPDLRRPRRPAGRPVRPALLRARDGQGDLRHRRVPARERRRRAARRRRRARHHPSRGTSATTVGAPSRSRARRSSREPRSSGSATSSACRLVEGRGPLARERRRRERRGVRPRRSPGSAARGGIPVRAGTHGALDGA